MFDQLKNYLTKKDNFTLFIVLVLLFALPIFTLSLQKRQNLKSSANEDSYDTPLESVADEDTPSFSNVENPQPDGIIIKYKEGSAAIHEDGDKIVKLALERTYRVKADPDQITQQIEQYNKDPLIEYAEADIYYNYCLTPNDPYFNKQWFLPSIKAPDAWSINNGSGSVTVAVVDSGVRTSHPDLSSKIVKIFNTQNDEPNHGTHVAGIAAAATNNGLGVAGTGFNVKLILADVGGKTQIRLSDAINGIKWAADNNAASINMSWGGEKTNSLEEAINYAYNKGTVLVAAAGNESSNRAIYPAGYANVISVAALKQDDSLAGFSNRGSWVTIAAPGVDIVSTIGDSKYTSYSGTSMASPIVAGAAALVKSAFPSYTPTQIKQKLCSTADKISGTGSKFQCGKLNLYKALQGGQGGTPPPTQPPQTPPPTQTITFKLRFQGITEKANDQKVQTQIYKNGQVKVSNSAFPIVSDNSGVYNLVINNSSNILTTGAYVLRVKGESHLAKNLQNITISSPTQIIDLSNQESLQLRAGDVTDDNKITIEDISQISTYYTDFSVVVKTSDTKMVASDINKDGVITIQDLALVAINWSDLTIPGE